MIIGTFGQDLRYATRLLVRSPGFAAVAITTLALGIGAATTIFSVVNAVLLRPLPYREPARLANLWVDLGVGAQSLPAMSPGDFADYRRRSRSFEALAAGAGGQVVGATGALTGRGGEAERVDVSPVTASFFPMLGVDPIYGRHFTAGEEAPGGPKVVILSYGLWMRRYGGDPAIVGRSISLDGLDQTVVGVMPRDFHLWLPSEAFLITDSQIWTPLQFDYGTPLPRNFTFFTVFGRLRPGVTFGQAQSDMDGIARQLRAEHAELEAADMRVRVVPLQEDVVKHARPALIALFIAVGFVLLIACANVAHLLLARATAREREIAVRGALGASRWRVLRQLATESLVLAAAGGIIGIGLAWIATRALVSLNPANLPRLDAVRIDATVVLFAIAASTVTAVFFGLVPALRAAGIDLNRTLRATGSRSGTHLRVRNVMLIGEMAVALVLLIGAGLMVRSFTALQQVRPGFEPAGLLTFRVALPLAKYRKPDSRIALLREMEDQLRGLPGVTDVGLTSQLPLTGSGPLSPFAYNEETARNWESETSDGRGVSPAYFRTMGTRLIAGRYFDAFDPRDQSRIIVDETLAARAWPGESAVGKRLQVQPNGTPKPFAEVIGVVEHIRSHDLARAVRPQIYSPLPAVSRLFVVVRASTEPASLTAQVREVMARLDPDLPIDRVRPMSAYLADGLAQTRLSLLLMSFFGASALLLSCVGIYGVFSYAVGQRTREIGIRMALGQEPWRIRNLVLAEGLRMIAISTGIGWFIAYAVTRVASTFLYQVHPGDPATFATMAAVLVSVALAGCYIPARRATRVNPTIALKAE
ncbi:MAG: ABC transporter permease [Acidobacteriota bacterium]